MKFLADENFPRPAVHMLREQGFEVAWATEDSPGSADEDVLTQCANNQLTLLTLDKDFGELVFQRGLPAECGVILFRVEAESPAQFSEIALAALRSRDDWNGCFSVIGRGRIRMRRLPKRGTELGENEKQRYEESIE
jgi:predicted nuclease of predicted toxin-antitoxin system